jgi:glycosyltransferase involved in cell wall biosynthesis
MKHLVSILIPAYNAEAWIAHTVRSALAQTWPSKEIVIVDDGSRDHTLAIAQQFASKNVQVVTQDNQGAAASRNRAFSLCQGDYIQWLDADDLLSPDKVAKQMEVRERGCSNRTLLSCGWGHFMYRPRRAVFRSTSLWHDLSPRDWLFRKLDHHLHMADSTWLVNRELTESAGPWDTRLVFDDDGEYFCRVLLASDGVRFVPEGAVFYRMTGYDRLSYVGASSEKLESQWISMQLHIGYLRSLEDSERVREACVKYLQYLLMDFYPWRLDIARKAEHLATDLGGRLEIPHFSWKYEWIRRALGWGAAKMVQEYIQRIKLSVRRRWDKALFLLEGQ